MRNDNKIKTAFWLFGSAIFGIGLWTLGWMMQDSAFSENRISSPGLWLVTWGSSCVLATLPFGIVLLALGKAGEHREFQRTMIYGEINGWQALSRTSWLNRKRGGITLTANRSIVGRTFSLSLEAEERIFVDRFETALWAMTFGDWLWDRILAERVIPTTETVQHKREEWERTGRPALPRGTQ